MHTHCRRCCCCFSVHSIYSSHMPSKFYISEIYRLTHTLMLYIHLLYVCTRAWECVYMWECVRVSERLRLYLCVYMLVRGDNQICWKVQCSVALFAIETKDEEKNAFGIFFCGIGFLASIIPCLSHSISLCSLLLLFFSIMQLIVHTHTLIGNTSLAI